MALAESMVGWRCVPCFGLHRLRGNYCQCNAEPLLANRQYARRDPAESRQFAEGLNRQRARAAGRRPRIDPRLEGTPRDRTSIKHHPAIVPETDAESQPV
jgi:hypothetical protein